MVELDEFFLPQDHMFATRQYQVEKYLAGLTKKQIVSIVIFIIILNSYK